ncbi:unnamed protein product [Didymodactylos carnosus]|uniref:Caspase family p20 domain-containing protein n=1 Tax=Didymodactylos carnosus TaxID=1234261 RepID=A0A8S2QU79_9BILA|nr:unnamed protein product [Didymodactylos carnosus]CAF4113759.1 unnamed protein product [Didymodactylos carnosus]
MKILKVLIILCGLTLLYSTKTTRRRIALLIENSAYSDLQILPSVINDVRDMRSMLIKLKFKVLSAENVDLAQLYAYEKEFYREIKPNDAVLIYFAGHGYHCKNDTYFIPLDHKRAGSYSHQQLIRRLNKNKENIIFIYIIDTCPQNSVQCDNIPMKTDKTCLENPHIVIYATQLGSKAYDYETKRWQVVGYKNGQLTSGVLKHMKTPNMDIRKMAKMVKEYVKLYATRPQLPEMQDNCLNESFIFNSIEHEEF